MSNIIDFNKYRNKIKGITSKKVKRNTKKITEPVDTPTQTNPSPKKGWYFASLDESDTAAVLRAIGYFFGLIFGMLMIPVGFSTWIVRGLMFSVCSLGMSYLIVLRKA